jgi:hypothetical protein
MERATTIALSADEALVLFELLARELDERKSQRIPGVIDHPAEFWVLNGIHCDLERELVEPFKADYLELVAAARERIMDASDPERTFVIGS